MADSGHIDRTLLKELFLSSPSELFDVLEDINNKLREKGMIVSLCGDHEAEAEIKIQVGQKGNFYLILKVNSLEVGNLNRHVAKQISDYVTSKICDAIDRKNLSLEDLSLGVKVCVNGDKVYTPPEFP